MKLRAMRAAAAAVLLSCLCASLCAAKKQRLFDGIPFLVPDGDNATSVRLCLLEKVASTELKMLLLWLFGKPFEPERSPHRRTVVTPALPIGTRAFLISRNPYARLKSGYLDKIVLGKHCASYNPDWKEPCELTFGEFVEYITRMLPHVNNHFKA